MYIQYYYSSLNQVSLVKINNIENKDLFINNNTVGFWKIKTK